MAHTISTEKRIRQNERRRIRNRSFRSRLKNSLKDVAAAIEKADAGVAQAAFRVASGILDRAACKGLIHRNEAARRKSKLSARIAELSSAPPAAIP